MKKSVRKLIEENFLQKDTYDDEELDEDSLFKKSVDDMLENNVEELPTSNEPGLFALKSRTFPADCTSNSNEYKETSKVGSISRDFFDSPSELESSSENSVDERAKKKKKKWKKVPAVQDEKSDDDSDISNDLESDSHHFNESENEGKKNKTKRVKFDLPEDDESSLSSEEELSDDNEFAEDESEVEDDLSDNETEIDSTFVFSKSTREESEIEKGMAVKNQLNLWEVLLESRIMLQKCLVESNKLPKPNTYEKLWRQCSEQDKTDVIECRENLWDLLEKLIHIQNKYRQQCAEYLQTNGAKESESNMKEDEEEVAEGFKAKRRKLTEYPSVLEKLYDEYVPFRNNTIQKWNDRTKIASGKYAKSNFTAFDQPVLKQIEQIMSDKHRLIQRTHVKRSQYQIVGESKEENQTDEKDETALACASEIDAEIFDDDDFYHKLLRDYIERKTADISDPSQLGRKWIQLQNLRSKMKRKIDTRRTKGRKIKLNVHNKIVNFMAPNTLTRWEDNAIRELHNSVFGKTLLDNKH